MAARPGLSFLRKIAGLEADIGAVFLGASAPAAYADHLVVRRPIGEGVVRGVIADEAATISDELLEGGLRLLGPGVAVVI